jgi:hypothetical protein
VATRNREVLSRAKVTQLHYKDEAVFSFERFVSELKDAYDGCSIHYSESQKIEMLLDKIQPVWKAAEVDTCKAFCREKNYARFEEAAMDMSSRISEVFKDQIVRLRTYGGQGRGSRRVSEVSGGRIGERGRTGFRGRRMGGRGGCDMRGGCGGRGRGGERSTGAIGRRNYINGVYTADTNRAFTAEEQRSGVYQQRAEQSPARLLGSRRE